MAKRASTRPAGRVMFTGGSGKAGRHVVQYLVDSGYQVLNIDSKPLDNPKVRTLITDITDSGQVFNALSSYMGLHEFDPSLRPQQVDAVVHFAAIPRILIATDDECYRVNVMGTYAVIEAAVKLGIRKVVFASSETTYGVCFADGEMKPDYIPVDEDYDVCPEDSYATSKVVNERTARSFQRRSGFDIYGLRINNVIAPGQYAADFPGWLDHPERRRRNLFAYIDARDLGQMVDLCLTTDGLGFQVFNVANEDHSVRAKTAELIAQFYPGVPQKRPLGEDETFYSIDKAKRLLGFRPVHGWRTEIKG
jgi:nucleoside-diphosphate-sugar epimerase